MAAAAVGVACARRQGWGAACQPAARVTASPAAHVASPAAPCAPLSPPFPLSPSGFYAWFRIFDNKCGRRRSGEYAEQYTHDGDSAGIHSSGAGFDRVDAIEKWVPPKF